MNDFLTVPAARVPLRVVEGSCKGGQVEGGG